MLDMKEAMIAGIGGQTSIDVIKHFITQQPMKEVRLSRPARSTVRVNSETLPCLRAGVTSDGQLVVRFLGVKR